MMGTIVTVVASAVLLLQVTARLPEAATEIVRGLALLVEAVGELRAAGRRMDQPDVDE